MYIKTDFHQFLSKLLFRIIQIVALCAAALSHIVYENNVYPWKNFLHFEMVISELQEFALSFFFPV